MELVVGVDVATAEVRVVAADALGRQRVTARRALAEPANPRQGWWEQDARTWWPAVVSALSEVAQRLGSQRGAVIALSVCSTSGTAVALDRGGQPVAPALLYRDQRAVAEAEVAQDAADECWARLGLRVQASFALPKWAWLLRRPTVASRTARLGHAADVVVGRLIGELPPTDWSHALKSGYDAQHEEWATPAMDALAIPSHLLPEVRRPTEPVGRLSQEAARATGLPRHCEVRLGMTDACASQLAAGAALPGRFVSVLGSTLVLKGVSAHLVTDPAGAVYSHRHPDGWWLPGGASSTGARALRTWFAERDLRELDERAGRHGPARAVLYPLLDRGERFPFVAPHAEGFALGDVDDEVERYRAALEGVAFVERLGYERLAALGAAARPPVLATGGGSTSRTWNRIRACVLGVPVVAKPHASTALGACILAAAGTVHPTLAAAADAMTPAGAQIDPDEDERAALHASYERFVAAVAQRGWVTRPQTPRSQKTGPFQ